MIMELQWMVIDKIEENDGQCQTSIFQNHFERTRLNKYNSRFSMGIKGPRSGPLNYLDKVGPWFSAWMTFGEKGFVHWHIQGISLKSLVLDEFPRYSVGKGETMAWEALITYLCQAISHFWSNSLDFHVQIFRKISSKLSSRVSSIFNEFCIECFYQ